MADGGWRVTARGRDTGAEYTFRVDAPADASQQGVIMSAYRMHGEKVRTGEQREYLAPGGTAEYIG